MDLEYLRATSLEEAWVNFELDLPLEPGKDGSLNPFYVERPDNPANRLERELCLAYRKTPKYFFSGHRGCGKSTELRRLAVSAPILQKYFPVHFSIRDEADINNLDFRDVLLAIGGQLFRQYRQKGGHLPEQLLKELESWRGQVEVSVTNITRGTVSGFEIETGLDAFFASAGLKMKLEPRTRSEIRQVFDRNITGLISVINTIAAGIQAQEGRPPLVLVDDLDKPDIAPAVEIFCGHREVMLQPVCPIVYTVSSSIFYSREFESIRDRTVFLPNIKLHPQGKPDDHLPEGYQVIHEFVERRTMPGLINTDAIPLAGEMSGGVFRELCRVMRSAIGYALSARRDHIEQADIEHAAAEIRGEYRRILTAEQRDLLRRVRQTNQLDEPEKVAPLMQILAVLEYANGEPWCDIHPALARLLEE